MDTSLHRRFLYCFSLSLYIWINAAVIQMNCDTTDLMSQMKKVKDEIFKDYDTYIRPTNGTNTTEVESYFHPRQIIYLDETNAIFAMDSYLVLRWFDPRLKWNRSEYDGNLQMPKNMMWVPDIFIFNSHEMDSITDVPLVFGPDGWIWWVGPLHTQTYCPSISQSKTAYPGDEVECDIVIGSWSRDGWELDFKHSHELYLNALLNIHPRWELITDRARTYRNETYYECCPQPYISLHVILPMRRRPVPEIEATRTPCSLVQLLTLSVFWLPPDSNHKITLGGFLFVVLNILLVYVSWCTKSLIPVLFGVSFLKTTMLLVVSTILLQVLIVINLASQRGPSSPPSTITDILSGPIGKYTFLQPPASKHLSLDRIQPKEDSSKMELFTIVDKWKLLATATDRALFFLMTLAIIAVHYL